MREQDYQRFQDLMNEAAQYTIIPSGKDLGDMTTALFAALQGYRFKDVQNVVRCCYLSERFFPMLADIMRQFTAMIWPLVLKTAQKHGADRSVRFPDPAAHFAITQMGGWVRLCHQVNHGNDGEKAFGQYYRLGKAKGVTWADVPPYLVGNFTCYVLDVSTGEVLLREAFETSTLPNQASELVALVAEGMRVSA